jgi:Spy/CpxP family protein refolding chaperone
MLALALGGLVLFGHAALAQHGGGPGGGPGGGMGGPQMGGGMGGSPRGMGGAGMPPRENFVPQRPKTSGPQLGLPGRWWDDKKNAKMISLRPEQQKKMDALFEDNKTTLVTALGNLQHEEAKLQGMSPQELQDEGKVFAQIDRVAAARAELEKENARILMLIRQQLEPAQLNKLDSEIANLR